jgi:hypothetical protein
MGEQRGGDVANGDRTYAPFGDDYPETRDPETLAAEQKRVDAEVERLRELLDDPATGAQADARLMLCARTAAVTLEWARLDDGPRVMVARGSAILHREAADVRGPDFRDQLELAVVDDGAPGFPLVRLERLATSGMVQDTPTLVAEIGRDGEPALNHVVPLGGIVMKAYGSVTPSRGGRDFPAVPVPATPGPRVAVIDTGISMEQRTDGYLQNLLAPDNLDPLDVLPFPYPDGRLDAAAGHGSCVTGIIQQIAPGARVRVYKVTDPFGVGTDWQIAQAVKRAVDDGAEIINISMGTPTIDGAPPRAMRAALEALPPHVLVVCAAGNGASTDPMWPAAFSELLPGQVVAVGALDPDGSGAGFSSRGRYVTCSAIGRGVPSTYVIGKEDLAETGKSPADVFGENSWATCIGTSFAAPQITGGVARICHEYGLSPRIALRRLIEPAPHDDDFGRRVRILPGT